MRLLLVFCLIIVSVQCAVLPHSSHHIDSFIRNVNSEYGKDSYFIQKAGFKYSDVYNSQLKYQVLTAFHTAESLKALDLLQASSASMFNKNQWWHFFSFVLLLTEIMLLVVIVCIKVSKVKPINVVSGAQPIKEEA